MLERRARNGQSRPCPRRCELGKAPVRSSAAKTALRSSPVLRWCCVRAQKMERELVKWCACVEEQWHGSKARDAGETAAALLLLLFFAARARGRRQRARGREWGVERELAPWRSSLPRPWAQCRRTAAWWPARPGHCRPLVVRFQIGNGDSVGHQLTKTCLFPSLYLLNCVMVFQTNCPNVNSYM